LALKRTTSSRKKKKKTKKGKNHKFKNRGQAENKENNEKSHLEDCHVYT